jgi:hypothetical protein
MASPPVGQEFSKHVLTFIEAIETAANLVYGYDGNQANVIIVGHEAFRYLAMIPHFEPATRDDVGPIDKCEYVGRLGHRHVWWSRKRVRPDEAVLLGATSKCRINIIY